MIMSKNAKRIIRVFRDIALIILIGVIIYVAIKLKKNPELASSENIVKIVSSNSIIATMEFILLYMLKGISVIFPSAVINIASGMVFGFPYSILVSCMGIFVEFSVVYLIGRILGMGIVEEVRKKYPIVKRIDIFQKKTAFLQAL